MEDALVDALAVFLGNVLSIRDYEVDDGKTAFGQVMHEEAEHEPDGYAIELMADLKSDIEWCEQTMLTTVRLIEHVQTGQFLPDAAALDQLRKLRSSGKLRCAPLTGNVSLVPYQPDVCFKRCRVFYRQIGAMRSSISRRPSATSCNTTAAT